MGRGILIGLILLAWLAVGCGDDKNKNINRDRDRPRSSQKETSKEK